MTPRESFPLSSNPGSTASTETLRMLLEEYAVTLNGFLPETAPLGRLPNPYYAPWETLVESLSTLVESKALRSQVDKLPVLSTEHLASEQEWRRACVVLGFLAHAYIWGGDVAADVLPPSLSLPLLSVSHHLGIPPVATYASVNLWNFRTTNPALDFTDLDGLHSLHTFTGTEDESWFYVVSVAMEAQGASIIPTMLSALDAIQHRDYVTITAALRDLTACIESLGRLLERMHERCTPSVFYHRIRPFLAGSKNMAAAGLPNGVFYAEDAEGKGEWRQLRGGSNGQSSLIQFLDLVLGVEHTARGNSQPEGTRTNIKTSKQGVCGGEGSVSFHEEVRDYMPAPHRRFLKHVAEAYPGGMRTGVADLLAVTQEEEGGGQLSAEQVALQEAFQTATKALAEFRNQHLQIVARYIIIPSRQASSTQGVVNLATASSRVKGLTTSGGETELTGTGGTALLPFLKQSRDETFQAGELECRG